MAQEVCNGCSDQDIIDNIPELQSVSGDELKRRYVISTMASLCSVDILCVFMFCFTFACGLMRRVMNEKSFEMCICTLVMLKQ